MKKPKAIPSSSAKKSVARQPVDRFAKFKKENKKTTFKKEDRPIISESDAEEPKSRRGINRNPKSEEPIRSDSGARRNLARNSPTSERSRNQRGEEINRGSAGEKRELTRKPTGSERGRPPKREESNRSFAGEKREPTRKPAGSERGRPLKGEENSIAKKDSSTKSATSSVEGMRLNKYLAHSGIASRRAADTLIMQGHVTVNGVVVQEMGYKVKENDVVVYKGKNIKRVDKLVYYLLNKPRNVLSTSADERGRRTVLDIIAEKVPERIYPIGRLDRNTSGLIILTNDGELTKKLSHPSHKVPKVYQATLDKALSLKDLELIREGITLEDGPIKADSLHYMEGLSKSEVQIELHSGRNRIVRRIFEHLGYEVVKLDRVYYAGLTKKNLPRGRYRPLTKEEIRMLKHFV
jgi:23S rRNA pseudouridine2605 synthase